MKYAAAVDGFIIGYFERFAHRVQRFAGFDCYDLAAASMSVAICSIGWTGAQFFRALAGHRWLANTLLAGDCLLMIAYAELAWESWLNAKEFARWRSILCVAHPGKTRRENILVRLGWIAYIIGIAPATATHHLNHSALTRAIPVLLFFYFQNCDPLPPAESKIRQWLNALRLKPVTVSG